MPANKKNQKPSAAETPGDPLFNLHHAEAEAELARQNPAAMTTGGLSPDDRSIIGDDDAGEGATGPVDRQGQRRGQQPTGPEAGSTAGHH